MPEPATPLDHAPQLERAFPDAVPELDEELVVQAGAIPSALRGTYYVNGPGRFGRGGHRYGHWLDGDGMVAAVRLADGEARLQSRYVRSEKLSAEEEAGRPVYRAFGTSFENDRLLHGMALASPVNVSVYPFADTLLAFGEQGLPWELDATTLATRGQYTFGGKLKQITPFSAHPAIDPESGELFNFGVSFSAENPALNVYRFSANAAAQYRVRHRLPYPCSVHDFGLTADHCVFHLSPYLLDMAAFQKEGLHLMDCLDWRPELGSSIWICNRQDGRLRHKVPIGSGYCLHLIHCHEEGGALDVDVIEMTEPVYDQYKVPDFFPDVRTAAVKRYTIDLESGRLTGERALDSEILCDFPALDPRQGLGAYDSFWTLGIQATPYPGRKFFDCVLRHDWSAGTVADRYNAPPRCYLGGEPAFIPDPQRPGAGYTMCQLFDARDRSQSVLLFDAFDLAGGPIATLDQSAPIHLGFHAVWHAAAGA